MLEIKVTVELPGIPEALNNLADAIRKSAEAEVTQSAQNVQNVQSAEQPAPARRKRKPRGAEPAEPMNAEPAEPDTIDPDAVVVIKPADVPDEPAPPEPEPAAAPVAVEEAPAPAPEPEPAPPVTATSYSRGEIARAGAALCSKGKMNDLIALLRDKYGAVAITGIEDGRLQELAADLVSLGAEF